MPRKGELGIHLSSQTQTVEPRQHPRAGTDWKLSELRARAPPFPLFTEPGTQAHTEWNCRSVARWGHRGNCFLMPVQLGGSNWEGVGTRASPPGCWLAEASVSGGGPFCEGTRKPQRSCHPGPLPPPLLWARGAQSRNWSWLHGFSSRGTMAERGSGLGPPSGLLPPKDTANFWTHQLFVTPKKTKLSDASSLCLSYLHPNLAHNPRNPYLPAAGGRGKPLLRGRLLTEGRWQQLHHCGLCVVDKVFLFWGRLRGGECACQILSSTRFWGLLLSRGKENVGVCPHPQVGLKIWTCTEKKKIVCHTSLALGVQPRPQGHVRELPHNYSPSLSELGFFSMGSFGGSTIRSLYLATGEKKDRGSKCPRISTVVPRSWALKLLWERAVGPAWGVMTQYSTSFLLTSMTFSFSLHSSLYKPHILSLNNLKNACGLSHHLQN